MPGFHIEDPAAAAYDSRAARGGWPAAVLAWTNAIVVGTVERAANASRCGARGLAMGRDRQLPHAFARIHPRHHTPYVGMLVTAAISLAVALVMENRLDDLASIVNFGALSGFLLLHVSVFVHFAVKQRSRHYFMHWIVPAVGAAVVAAVFTGMSPLAVRVGLSWLVFGLVYGAVLARRRHTALELSA